MGPDVVRLCSPVEGLSVDPCVVISASAVDVKSVGPLVARVCSEPVDGLCVGPRELASSVETETVVPTVV